MWGGRKPHKADAELEAAAWPFAIWRSHNDDSDLRLADNR